jgi:hypothetical protein
MMRWASPAVTLMIVALTTLVAGTQLALTAFMSSIMNIPLMERRVEVDPARTA